MTKILKAICTGIAFSFSTLAWAAPLSVEKIIDSKYVDELKEKGFVIAVHNGVNEDYSLIPDCKFKDLCNSRKISKDEKGFAYTLEHLYLLPKSELLANNNTGKTNLTVDDISVVMRSTSKMINTKYYSNRRKKTMPLYKKTYMVDNETDRNRIEDQTDGRADGRIFYILQDDASFGETLYEEKIETLDYEIYGYYTNLDTMGIGFIKAIKPRNLGISIMALDCGDSIILYMCMDANCKKFPSIDSIMTDSLSARMVALKNWIVTLI